MVSRIGHMGLRVRNLDEAVAFFSDVLLLQETLREPGRSFMTCNDRHHELILIEGSRDGCDHIGLEVDGPEALEETLASAQAAGGKRLGPVTGEPGIAGGEFIEGPGGHVFKLFHGMETVPVPGPDPTGVRPSRFEHVSLKLVNPAPMERFISEGLGFQFSDRMGGSMASWWHCDPDHHGIALQRAPANQLHHHAWTQPDLNAQGATADRLAARGQTLRWGPGRHGPGNNHFIYFKGPSGALIECCSDIAQFGPGSTYEPSDWTFRPSSVSLWGGVTPPRFLLAGAPLVRS